MLKVLLVEDQPLYRMTLKTIVDWERLGMQIVADVHNGQEALNIIDAQHVDIVLTDMKMPVMDGLELIRSVQSKKPEIQFIALSAYDEFYLVKSAFKLGVKEYVLKSEISEERMIQVIQNIKTEIERMKLESHRQRKIESYFDENRFLLKNKLFNELIGGEDEEIPEVLKKMDILGIDIKKDCAMMTMVIIARFNDYSTSDGENITSDRLLRELRMVGCIGEQQATACNQPAPFPRKESEVIFPVLHSAAFNKEKKEKKGTDIINDLQEILKNENTGEVFYSSNGEFVVVLSHQDDNSEYTLQQNAFMFYDRVEREIKNKYGVDIYGGASLGGDGPEGLVKGYRQASHAARYHFINEKSRLVTFHSLITHATSVLTSKVVNQKMESLRELLNESDYGRIPENINLFRIDSREVSIGNIDCIKDLFEKYYYFIHDFAQAHDILEDVGPYLKQYSGGLREYGNLRGLNEWIAGLVKKIGETMLKGSPLIKNAKRYIEQHYREEISLTSMAEELRVNSSYLSRVFKKEVGCNFTDYISKVRIQAAIDFMQKSDLKIYEIAELVGYSIPENFTRMFKKVVGKSPKNLFKQ